MECEVCRSACRFSTMMMLVMKSADVGFATYTVLYVWLTRIGASCGSVEDEEGIYTRVMGLACRLVPRLYHGPKRGALIVEPAVVCELAGIRPEAADLLLCIHCNPCAADNDGADKQQAVRASSRCCGRALPGRRERGVIVVHIHDKK
eukprot:3939797-Rhodomonas_salina.8